MVDAPCFEHVARGALYVVADFHEAVQREELDSCRLLEGAPRLERLLGELDPLGLGIGEAEDARAPVTGPAGVVELELLVQRHVGAALTQRPGGRAAHDPRADDSTPRHGRTLRTCFAGPSRSTRPFWPELADRGARRRRHGRADRHRRTVLPRRAIRG